MTPGSVDTMRVLSSIVASKDLQDELMKEKARVLLFGYMDVIEKEVEVELVQIKEYSAKLSGIIS